MTDTNLSRLLSEIERDPSYADALVRVRAARETAAQLRAMRKQAGLTQAELGKRLGVSQARISHVESGLLDHLPAIDFVYLYAEACGSNISLQTSGKAQNDPEHDGKPSRQGRSLAIIDARKFDGEMLARSLIARGVGKDIVVFESAAELYLHRPQLPTLSAILLNIRGRKPTSQSTAKEIRNLVESEAAPVILLTETDEPSEVLTALKLGVRGFLPSSVGLDACIEAIRLALAGGVFVPSSAALSAWQRLDTDETPSESVLILRQAAVMDALRRGKSNKTIAYELKMAETTVKVHVRNIMKKIKATNRTEAIYKINDLYHSAESPGGEEKPAQPGLGSGAATKPAWRS